VLQGLWWWLGTLLHTELCIVLGIVPLRVMLVISHVNWQRWARAMPSVTSANAYVRIWKRHGFGGEEDLETVNAYDFHPFVDFTRASEISATKVSGKTQA